MSDSSQSQGVALDVASRHVFDSDDAPVGSNARAARAMTSEHTTTVVQTKHRSVVASGAKRNWSSRRIVATVVAAVGLGAFAIAGAAAGDNVPQTTLVGAMPVREMPEDAATAMGPVRNTTVKYDPRNTELLISLGITSVITNSNETTADAMAVQANLDAIEAERIAEAKRVAAELEATRLRNEAGATTNAEALAEMERLGIRRGVFLPPVKGSSVSSPYGYRIDPVYGGISFHLGMDLALECTAPVTASAAGVVTVAGYNFSGLGEYVEIDHGGIITGYGHMFENSIVVVPGQWVEEGELIGLVGNTGKSTGCHVHWVGRTSLNEYFDPALFLGGLT
ncbi:MAG: M23 family metallopeptidase [Propionibacteriaceae bacterium]|nr:M23 family metallopeptidase [Propionibacteriaceae bacterium]